MSINREHLLQHIPDEKILTLKKLVDKIEIVINKHEILSTDFLDPYEVELHKSILNRFSEISYSIWGGFKEAERQSILIYPQYMFKCDYPINKFSLEKINISHKDILGALLGLGIAREKIGDIVINDDYIHFFVKSEISKYIEFNLKKIGRFNISFCDANFYYKENEYNNFNIIISSLRLDAFISAVTKESRSTALKLVQSGRVKVNFKTEYKSNFNLSENDLISIRKYGRFIFHKIENKTKKDKYVIIVRVPK